MCPFSVFVVTVRDAAGVIFLFLGTASQSSIFAVQVSEFKFS